jgi:hypothetical protein
MHADMAASDDNPRPQPDNEAILDELAAELSLMLMYLHSWKEPPFGAVRFWKTFSFDIVDDLAEQGLIRDSHRAKSAYLTDAGIQRARELLARYSPVAASVDDATERHR